MPRIGDVPRLILAPAALWFIKFIVVSATCNLPVDDGADALFVLVLFNTTIDFYAGFVAFTDDFAAGFLFVGVVCACPTDSKPNNTILNNIFFISPFYMW